MEGRAMGPKTPGPCGCPLGVTRAVAEGEEATSGVPGERKSRILVPGAQPWRPPWPSRVPPASPTPAFPAWAAASPPPFVDTRNSAPALPSAWRSPLPVSLSVLSFLLFAPYRCIYSCPKEAALAQACADVLHSQLLAQRDEPHSQAAVPSAVRSK